MSRITAVFVGLLFCTTCTGNFASEGQYEDLPPPMTPRVDFELDESSADVLNPERGFYTGFDLLRPNGASLRDRGHSLALAIVRLDAFRDRPIDGPTLAAIEAGFDQVRAAGIKIILRFTYNAAFAPDASREQILAHIDQLEPILRANDDVIAVMQAGFIGAWGEWHSSTNGLDNDADRNAILGALLESLPERRSVQVRTPMFKEAAVGAPIDEDEAFTGTGRARVGHHNDCFLASDDDLGTYAEPVESWLDYVAQDSRFVPMGGETCAVYPPRTDCDAAIAALAGHHWSYLNRDYQRAVIDEWSTQGCESEIRQRLGYRLVATWISHTDAVEPGGLLEVDVEIENLGFAAPFNERPVYLVLTGPDGRRHTTLLADVDPRRWAAGETAMVVARLEVPSDLEPGDYSLALWLPDSDERLAADPRYAIRLANADTWEAATGDNVLSRALVVEAP